MSQKGISRACREITEGLKWEIVLGVVYLLKEPEHIAVERAPTKA